MKITTWMNFSRKPGQVQERTLCFSETVKNAGPDNWLQKLTLLISLTSHMYKLWSLYIHVSFEFFSSNATAIVSGYLAFFGSAVVWLKTKKNTLIVVAAHWQGYLSRKVKINQRFIFWVIEKIRSRVSFIWQKRAAAISYRWKCQIIGNSF